MLSFHGNLLTMCSFERRKATAIFMENLHTTILMFLSFGGKVLALLLFFEIDTLLTAEPLHSLLNN